MFVRQRIFLFYFCTNNNFTVKTYGKGKVDGSRKRERERALSVCLFKSLWFEFVNVCFANCINLWKYLRGKCEAIKHIWSFEKGAS